MGLARARLAKPQLVGRRTVVAGLLGVIVAAGTTVPIGAARADRAGPASPATTPAVRIASRTITVAHVRHWLVVAMHSATPADTPPTAAEIQAITRCAIALAPLSSTMPALPTAARAACLRLHGPVLTQVVDFLVQAAWLELEARFQGVSVTAAEMNRAFVSQKRQAFRTEAAFQAFLRSSGQSQRDILLRVRLGLISEKLAARVPPAELSSYVAGFHARWRAQTACGAPYYLARHCGGRLPSG